MADASALAGLLDRAGKVFSLARSLAWDLEQDHKSQGPVVMAGVQPAWQQHGERIKELVEATLGVRDIIQNPPDGLDDVVKQLCEAGRLAKRLTPRAYDSETNYHFGVLDLWPDLNTVAQDGYEAVKAARKAARLDDPFAVFVEPKPTGTSGAVEAIAVVPTLDEIRAKVQAARERTRHPNASHNPIRMAADAYNDFATIVRMLDKCGIAAPPLPDHRLHPLQTMNYVLQKLDDVELALNRAEVSSSGAAAHDQPEADKGDFIERLLAGPDDVELAPRELALLEAHLKQAIDFAAVQRERRAHPTQESKSWNRHSKLKLIRDFNRNLHAAAGATAQPAQPSADDPSAATTTGAPRKRGRRKADDATQQREAKLAADWERARDGGTYKAEFAKENRMSVKQLDALLDRVAKRKRDSE